MGVHQTCKPYFCGFDEPNCYKPMFSRDLLKAKRFSSDTSAWHELYDQLGMDYSQRNYIVAGIHDKGFLNSNIQRIGEDNG